MKRSLYWRSFANGGGRQYRASYCPGGYRSMNASATSKQYHAKVYTLAEEIANAVTHGIGAIFSVVGLSVLVLVAAVTQDPYRVIGVTVFGVTMLLMYLASTLYHALPHPPVKRVLRIADHCAIYLLIAGTYTPFMIVSMRGIWGWTLFGILWGAAMMGCIFKMFFTGKFDFLSTMMYVAMGWVAIIALKPALEMIPMGALLLLLIGGLAYTSGVVFYIWDRCPYNHAIWHCFVMAGTAVHFAAVYFFIAMDGVVA